MVADTLPASRNAPEPPGSRAAVTVLIVEDDIAFRELLALHISSAGYRVLLAEDAAVGGRMLLSARPDLLVLDILLPYLGGLELLEAMRQDPDVGHIPVVCLTALRDDATYARAAELGAAGFLTKPVQKDELLAALAGALKRARARGA